MNKITKKRLNERESDLTGLFTVDSVYSGGNLIYRSHVKFCPIHIGWVFYLNFNFSCQSIRLVTLPWTVDPPLRSHFSKDCETSYISNNSQTIGDF